MARHRNPKCQQCAKLSTAEAQQRECWIDSCRQKRYYHQNHEAINRDRKTQRRRQQMSEMIPSPQIWEIGDESVVTPTLVYYRKTKESPVHAIGAELRLDGVVVRSFQLRPVHCLGATSRKLKAWQQEALQILSDRFGREVGKFKAIKELHPSQCPLCYVQESDSDGTGESDA